MCRLLAGTIRAAIRVSDEVPVLICPARNASHRSDRRNTRRVYGNQSDTLHSEQKIVDSLATHIPIRSQSNLRELKRSCLHPLRTAERIVPTSCELHSPQQVIEKETVGDWCLVIIARCSRQPFQSLRRKTKADASELARYRQSAALVVLYKSVHMLDL